MYMHQQNHSCPNTSSILYLSTAAQKFDQICLPVFIDSKTDYDVKYYIGKFLIMPLFPEPKPLV